MPLLVAGFVNADVHEVIKSSGAFRFDVVQSSVNAAPDRQIKVTGESASRICPGNIGCYDTMLRTLYAMCPAFNLYKGSSEVKTSPGARGFDPLIITRTSPVTERTVILMPFISPCMNPEVTYTILIKVKVCIFYN